MATSSSPQPLAVGERNSTYASILDNKQSGQVQAKIELKQVEFIHGEATIKFSMEEVQQYAKEEGLHQALVIKFSQDQYDMQDIRKMLPKQFGTQGRCLVGWLARRHVLIRFDRHDDYVLAAAKSVNYLAVNGQELQMRIFPWTITFSPKEETSKAFVWISFPNLPPMLFAKQSLLSIASAAGKPLVIDKATQEKSRPSTARVKVELDLLGKLPQSLRIKFVDDKSGKVIEHLQKFVYDNLPLYCTCCKRQGHDVNTCRLISTKNRDSGLNGDVEQNDDLTTAEKFQGDVRQLLNEKRQLLGVIDAARTHGSKADLTEANTRDGQAIVPVDRALARMSQAMVVEAGNADSHGVPIAANASDRDEQTVAKNVGQLEGCVIEHAGRHLAKVMLPTVDAFSNQEQTIVEQKDKATILSGKNVEKEAVQWENTQQLDAHKKYTKTGNYLPKNDATGQFEKNNVGQVELLNLQHELTTKVHNNFVNEGSLGHKENSEKQTIDEKVSLVGRVDQLHGHVVDSKNEKGNFSNSFGEVGEQQRQEQIVGKKEGHGDIDLLTLRHETTGKELNNMDSVGSFGQQERSNEEDVGLVGRVDQLHGHIVAAMKEHTDRATNSGQLERSNEEDVGHVEANSVQHMCDFKKSSTALLENISTEIMEESHKSVQLLINKSRGHVENKIMEQVIKCAGHMETSTFLGKISVTNGQNTNVLDGKQCQKATAFSSCNNGNKSHAIQAVTIENSSVQLLKEKQCQKAYVSSSNVGNKSTVENYTAGTLEKACVDSSPGLQGVTASNSFRVGLNTSHNEVPSNDMFDKCIQPSHNQKTLSMISSASDAQEDVSDNLHEAVNSRRKSWADIAEEHDDEEENSQDFRSSTRQGGKGNEGAVALIEQVAPTLHFSNPNVERIIKDAQHEMMMKESIVKQPLVALNTSVYEVPSNSLESFGEYGGESGQLMISNGNNNEVHEKQESARKLSYSDCKAVTPSRRSRRSTRSRKN